MNLFWNNCQGNVWCSFQNLNIYHQAFNNMYGVYIIWQDSVTVKVGGGNIRDQVLLDRVNPEIMIAYPRALMTWAYVDINSIEGVKSYFITTLTPVINRGQITANLLPSNPPW